jgi:hypothetical protein
MFTVEPEDDSDTVPLVVVNELDVGMTAQTGLGRTARGPTASSAVNNLRSDSRDLDAIFMYVEEAVFDWITPNSGEISVREGVESRDFFG